MSPLSPPSPNRAGEVASRQTAFIAAARDLLKPSPVRLNHCPDWFRRLVRQEFSEPGRTVPTGSSASWAAIARLNQAMPDLGLDHWGSTPWRDGLAFVSEPYLDVARVIAGKALAERLGCDFQVSPNSWWYPGATTRLIWTPKGAAR